MIHVSDDIEKKVLKVVTPSQSDRKKLEEVIQDFKKQVKQEIAKRDLPVSIEIVGSTAKDTYLKNNLDIDLFIVFPTTFSKENIGHNSLSIGRKILKNTEECYAEHPYIRGYFKNNKVEIVPCYKIENASQKLSAVDRTPLHTKYVKEHLHESQKQEVRLFKQFLIGIGCYGAEAEIEGFSGYLCEIVIMKYGSFKKLIQHAQQWKFGEKLALSHGDYPSFDTPLIFIDPVDSDRNVASAISKEKFDLFVKACREYLKKSRITFFFPNEIKPWSLEKIRAEIEKQENLYVGVKIVKPDIIAENLHPQIRKAVRSIWEVCERYGFTIYDVTYHVDDPGKLVFIVVNTKNGPLSKTFVHKGPPARLEKNVKEFIQKWEDDPRVTKKPYEENDRLHVEIEREYTDIKNLLRDRIKNLSMGKHLDESIKVKYEIVELDNLLRDNLRVFWTAYLDKKMPWER
jgi:tRNA nucleotidyltransferase (CCA-adding enzyme)